MKKGPTRNTIFEGGSSIGEEALGHALEAEVPLCKFCLTICENEHCISMIAVKEGVFDCLITSIKNNIFYCHFNFF